MAGWKKDWHMYALSCLKRQAEWSELVTGVLVMFFQQLQTEKIQPKSMVQTWHVTDSQIFYLHYTIHKLRMLKKLNPV
jgi:hypothetical protein